MNQYFVVLQKELLQIWRNKQLIWVPLVITLLAIMDLFSYYFLPELIEFAGGLPEGAILEIPDLTPAEAIMMGIEQLNLFGVLIVILISMGMIASERKSLIAEIMFVKPLQPFYYILAKWTTQVTLTILALTIGLFLNWYYSNLLFGEIPFTIFLNVLFFYSLWFIFVISISMFYNSFLKEQGIVVACTIITLLMMSIVNMIFGHHLPYFPNQLSSEIYVLVNTETIPTNLSMIAMIMFTIIIALILASSFLFKRIKL